jgi:hypothetical protein
MMHFSASSFYYRLFCHKLGPRSFSDSELILKISFWTFGRILWTVHLSIVRSLYLHNTTQKKCGYASIPRLGYEPATALFERFKIVRALTCLSHCYRPLSCPNVFLSNFFWNTLHLCHFLRVRYQVLHDSLQDELRTVNRTITAIITIDTAIITIELCIDYYVLQEGRLADIHKLKHWKQQLQKHQYLINSSLWGVQSRVSERRTRTGEVEFWLHFAYLCAMSWRVLRVPGIACGR